MELKHRIINCKLVFQEGYIYYKLFRDASSKREFEKIYYHKAQVKTPVCLREGLKWKPRSIDSIFRRGDK